MRTLSTERKHADYVQRKLAHALITFWGSLLSKMVEDGKSGRRIA